MNFSDYSISDLVSLYSESIKELKKRKVLRTNNVVGELGEYYVFTQYEKSSNLPNLTAVPIGTKNINAISQDGDRYSIKSTTGNVTGVIYGLQPPSSEIVDKPLFEYLVICKMDNNCTLEGIYQLSWNNFLKHKKWHSRMKAWNIAITNAVKNDSVVIFEKDSGKTDEETNEGGKNDFSDCQNNDSIVSITWNKTEKVDHVVVREKVATRLSKMLRCNYIKMSQSRYVSTDNESALFVLSASYSQKNGEYWYSINDENIPWMELYPSCYVAFALGSFDKVLVFDFLNFKKLLDGCLHTSEDLNIGKRAHYHFSFAVDGSKVFFKKKLPTRDFIDVTKFLK